MKIARIQVYRAQFENIKMNDDEYIASLFLRVSKIVNNMKAMKECVNFRKIIRYLPSSFNPKVSAIEETTDWETLTMN